MSPLALTGWGVVSAAGAGADHFATRLDGSSAAESDASSLYAEPLPASEGHAFAGFSSREFLGRKGTAFLDRRSALALVACDLALKSGALEVSDTNRHRIGVVLGTTWGSLQSMCDFTRDTLVEDRPYLVNAALFPNTVMNCSSGQAAIRFGLKGVNATVSGGQAAFLNALQYAATVLNRSYSDILLAGAVEEFTPYTAWATHLAGRNGAAITAGEGAAVFLLQRAETAAAAERPVLVHVLSINLGFRPTGQGHGLALCLERSIRKSLCEAGVAPGDVRLAATCEGPEGESGGIETEALRLVFGAAPLERLSLKKRFGECHAVSGAFQLAAVLARRDTGAADTWPFVMTAWTDDGAYGTAVFQGGN